MGYFAGVGRERSGWRLYFTAEQEGHLASCSGGGRYC